LGAVVVQFWAAAQLADFLHQLVAGHTVVGVVHLALPHLQMVAMVPLVY
jgi:hypothetical protein